MTADEDFLKYVFQERGDVGIRLDLSMPGQAFVEKIEPVKGLFELCFPGLHEGDVLYSINSSSVLGMQFSDVMNLLRKSLSSQTNTTLEFIPAANSFMSAENAVNAWKENELKALDDGEFEVVFPSSEPLGFRLTESFLMVQPICLATTSVDILKPFLHHAIVKINQHVVLGYQYKDVLQLLHDPAHFPMQVWLWDITRDENDVYIILTVPSRDHFSSMGLRPVDLMLEVPSVHSLICRNKLSTENNTNFSKSSTALQNGIRKDQLLMAVNGIPTLFLPQDPATGISHISMLHGTMHNLLDKPRRLLFRDVKLYQQEFREQRPTSPWNRQKSSVPIDSCTKPNSLAMKIEVVSSRFEELVEKYALPSLENVDQPLRRKWSDSSVHRVVVPPTGEPLGIQLETDFTGKFTVFKCYNRTWSQAKRVIRERDRIVSINRVNVGEYSAEEMDRLLRSHVDERQIVIARPKSSSLWSMAKSWLQLNTSVKTAQVQDYEN
ncbi:hypothetical protein LEN26_005762 [Aphanomyces euteiches]|nr:hypothetical protein AeMF1_001188 [Aphanomyces euteiches]KAH9137396.1 hypothetical protein LEN26_005762 [Aphanomyces euteiches]KAH9189320.1 hypothetical protein AeNC1_008698 [Aphanomyces euteiches]